MRQDDDLVSREQSNVRHRTKFWNLKPHWCFVAMDQQTFEDLPQPVALVVDDEALIRMDTSGMVSDAGFHVIEARSADEALEFLKQHSSLQLVFTDIQMPGDMDGVQLAQYIDEHWPHIKVIVASGAVQPAEGILPDGTTFLNKPISIEVVNRSLEEHFGASVERG